MKEHNIKILKEKIQINNPEFTDELLELLTEFFMESIGLELQHEISQMKRY